MTDDIVTRLRAEGVQQADDEMAELVDEAADEIERLRLLRPSALLQEIERLRAIVSDLAAIRGYVPAQFVKFVDRAREATKETNP